MSQGTETVEKTARPGRRSGPFKKGLMGAAGALFLAASAVAVAPSAHADGFVAKFQNQNNKKCVAVDAADRRKVGQADCSDARALWFYDQDTAQMINFVTGDCLDHVRWTSGAPYMSPCGSADEGQWWMVGDRGGYWQISPMNSVKVLTSWADGSITIARTENVDDQRKWRYNRL
ncbi:RICIN domain-containing protein [Streptomyces sp. YS415]|uniref:RICIN domain-containing protein n=1 Tax=Streptomyces sp. YS415 TaxID=2944806 RepID=UPI002021C274|nr:ricin-type beta-trefoil lectin domain protein [Streptomyces sp. YS415]MCL7429408.1 RICIN domain-containing protein [Streptomyces sp. YS415]